MRFYFKLSGIISDFVLWGVLLGIVFLTSTVILPIFSPDKFHRSQVVTLYFQDVSQLTLGSPVNFMGTEVGHVMQLKTVTLKDNSRKVRVRIKLDRDAPHIDDGSRFTIEFNGLAGAKSLEVMPALGGLNTAEKPQNSVEEPIRLKDVFNAQMLLAKELENASVNISTAIGNSKNEHLLQRLYIEKMQKIDRQMNDLKNSLVSLVRSLQHGASIFLPMFRDIDRQMQLSSIQAMKLANKTGSSSFRRGVSRSLNGMTVMNRDSVKSLQMSQKADAEFSRTFSSTAQMLTTIQAAAQNRSMAVFDMLGKGETYFKQTTLFLEHYQQTHMMAPNPHALKSLEQKTETLSKQTKTLSDTFLAPKHPKK